MRNIANEDANDEGYRFRNLSAQSIAEEIASIGAHFYVYSERIVSLGINGIYVSTLLFGAEDRNDFLAVLREIGVKNHLHESAIIEQLEFCKERISYSTLAEGTF